MREKLIERIVRMLSGLDEAKLKSIYQFVLHLTK